MHKLLGILLSLSLTFSSFSQLADNQSIKFEANIVKQGADAVLEIKAALPKGLGLLPAASPVPNDPFVVALQLDSPWTSYLVLDKTATTWGTAQKMPNPAGTSDSLVIYRDSVTYQYPLQLPDQFEGTLTGKFSWLGMQGNEFPSGEETFSAKLQTGNLADKVTTIGPTGQQTEESLWEIFLKGFLAGLGAFIMPCIYAMVPVTVSFFTKRSKTRKQGITNAVVYAASIIGIFTLLGFLITIFFGKGALNDLASSAAFNIGVFVLFLIFGISFLGAFEITLPASWSNKVDAKAGLNSYSGIFFLALTLVIVSFSCTVPFIGALTVLIAKGSFWAPLVGFFAFSLALALPFAVFTIFPSLLNNMAKSGGWLNTVKVSLGFGELALALKFLSSADLAYHWRLLDREVYLALWIVIFGLLGLYLLGKLKFHHDDHLPKNEYGLPYLTVTRLFFAIAALSFTVYMIPGLWGAPLNGISAWVPEMKTQDFRLGSATTLATPSQASNALQPKKYTDLLESEIPGVNTFFDYEEALAAARQAKKPLMIDFTGHSCANCRKMEREVLSDPQVVQRLQNDFVVVSLYVDDKFKLPEEEWTVSNLDGRTLKRMGEKNLDFEVALTNNNAQPYYVFVDGSGQLIIPEGYGYVPGVDKFLAHLDKVQATYKAGGQ